MTDPRWIERYLIDTESAYLAGDIELETVDFVRFELGDVLRRKGLLSKKITIDDYVAAARSIDDLRITVHITTADVLEQAGRACGQADDRVLRRGTRRVVGRAGPDDSDGRCEALQRCGRRGEDTAARRLPTVNLAREVLLTLGAELRRMTDGFANELAVAWPVLPAGPGRR